LGLWETDTSTPSKVLESTLTYLFDLLKLNLLKLNLLKLNLLNRLDL